MFGIGSDTMLPLPASPTNSSVSSSDLDTESTGSFFHDRSTTLGTLMGVNFPAITFRANSQHRDNQATAGVVPSSKKKKKTTAIVSVAERRRRRWWRLCRDGGSKPASLGDFLEVERRFGDVDFCNHTAAELEGVVVGQPEHVVHGRLLFADGRVLPPAQVAVGTSTAGVLRRFPVSLTGICSGGSG
ncbi:hypothetical protein K2173_027131 [Erythroxylum novogranatense]|uniref:Uncharacterized protein n=1 Tax=Erythroxylum novogranatense TaxID=1862640 RepID=A0AAV8U175_9ROSI|nr:hypothetical protein K2173_027131 [Erythroxylum novogranatense]